jgi:hypothetical protein
MALLEQLKTSTVPLKPLFSISIVINLLFLVLSAMSIFILPPEIPLFYGMPKSNAQVAPSFMIIVPSLSSFIFTTINYIAALKLNQQYLKKTLAFASIAATILSSIATYKIISLVGSI